MKIMRYAVCLCVLLLLTRTTVRTQKKVHAPIIYRGQKKPPNILFAISDDQSFAHTSLAGSTFVNTPAFDRVAREGVYFANCIAASPGCAPSRSAIVTGRYPWQNEQAGQHASAWLKKFVSFIDVLNAKGYATGRTGKGVGPFYLAKGPKDSLIRETDPAGPAHSNITYDRKRRRTNYQSASERNNRETGGADKTTENRYVREKEDKGAGGNDRVSKDQQTPPKGYTKGMSRTDYFGNFKYFLDNAKGDKPFFFWYGGREPHRGYEKDSWKRMGKKLSEVQVPGFLPDTEEIRGDLLDYAVEIEWFDRHLGMMLKYLEEIGELENTVVIVTSDNGKPFPRAKANAYEYGVHVPMAVRYPNGFLGGRVVKDPVSFVDIAPTVLELSGISLKDATVRSTLPKMMPITGSSLVDVLASDQQGWVHGPETFVLSGRERHSSSRYLNWGYPQRALRSGNFLYIWNMKPERWPAGAPQKYDPKDTSRLLPLHGVGADGNYITPMTAFTDIDDSPSKTLLLEHAKDENTKAFFDLAVAKRPEFELYDIRKDPFCLENLSDNPNFTKEEKRLKANLTEKLKTTEDPRVVGPDREIFDSYRRYSPIRKFPEPRQNGR